MKRNIRRIWYQLLIAPFMISFLIIYAVLIVFAISMDTAALALGPALLTAIILCILERMASHGHPRWLAMNLTPNFYAVRTITGRYSIFQRRVAARGHVDCRELLRSLVQEQYRLPAALPPGRYQAITHEPLLRRLQKMESARNIAVEPAYTANLEAICAAMTVGRCKKCKRHCPFLAQRMHMRQFYKVAFEIKSNHK